ncbi:MAG: GntR family transcriptional regulator [Vescimonas sp.]
MLTYPLNKESGRSLYEQLYEGIRRDILSGTLPAHQRLPSKRALAQHLEVSIITVQNAYEQLAAEGYIYSQEKRGYYVSPVERPLQAAARQPAPLPPEPEQKTYFLDLVTNSIDRAYFPLPSGPASCGRRCWSGTRPCCRPPPTTGRRSCAGPSATICASSVA